MKVWKDNSLTIVLMAAFALSMVGHVFSGWLSNNKELIEHGAQAVSLGAYLVGGEFLSSLFENWESEFLQMGAYVFLTAWLIQRGSAESRDPDAPDREAVADAETPQANKPRGARASGLLRWVYENSLGLALLALFLISFVLHWINSARMADDMALLHGMAAQGVWARLADSAFWFESFQNWQSEFLSTAMLVVLSIYLRQKHSPESKAVAAPDSSTGA